MIGEVGPAELEALIAARPRIASAFDVIRVRSLGERESIDVVQHALAGNAIVARASQDTLAEAYELAPAVPAGIAAPGNTLRLISAASAEVLEEGRDVITSADVADDARGHLGPAADDARPDAAADARGRARVLRGARARPAEAVDGVVERIALAQAPGSTDPTRPLGVLLLVGPTGTGKTELAQGARRVHVRLRRRG